jgi:Predicted integral membrane protein
LAPLITFATANHKDDYEKRIAVLYLENDGSVENAYFSDGLTEEIMSRVSRIDKISVVSRFDVAVYKEKQINLDIIREDLKADFILTGKVSNINNRIRISVELVDLSQRKILWTESFNVLKENIFEVQDKMALNIVDNLNISFKSEEKDLLLLDPAKNLASINRHEKIKKDERVKRGKKGDIRQLIMELTNISKKTVQM